jgi:IS1 family transposase
LQGSVLIWLLVFLSLPFLRPSCNWREFAGATASYHDRHPKVLFSDFLECIFEFDVYANRHEVVSGPVAFQFYPFQSHLKSDGMLAARSERETSENYGAIERIVYVYRGENQLQRNAGRIQNGEAHWNVNLLRQVNRVFRWRAPVGKLNPLPHSYPLKLYAISGGISGLSGFPSLPTYDYASYNPDGHEYPFGPLKGCVPMWRVCVGFFGVIGGYLFGVFSKTRPRFLVGMAVFAAAVVIWLTGHEPCEEKCNQDKYQSSDSPSFHVNNVTQKLLTTLDYCNTLLSIGRAQMANVLPMDKQTAVISALAEGSGIRQIERMTGVHRDTIMRLGVRVGEGCAKLLDSKMRALSCRQLQFDEIWGFIGKKERHLRPDDDPTLGDVWTFCAIDPDTKLVPSFKVGKRNSATANAFVADVANRMANRVQISSDALREYVEAIELSFGSEVDFAQIIKTYTHDDSIIAERKFSAPEVVTTEKRRVSGFPNMHLASTSHVERLNGTTRLHMRRLTRLTYAFSKKLENFEAATALHFAYYNFVKRHNAIRCTPAMAAGVERDFWTVGDLIEAAA